MNLLPDDSFFDESVDFINQHFNNEEELKERLKNITSISDISTFVGLVMIKRSHPEEDLSSYLEKRQEAARQRLFSDIN